MKTSSFLLGSWTAGIFLLGLLQGSAGLVACSNHCAYPTISSNGEIVAFLSMATNWHSRSVNEITNDFEHVVVYHRQRHASLILVTGSQYGYPQISGDGRWVVYEQYGDPLQGNDTNNVHDVYASEFVFGTKANKFTSLIYLSQSTDNRCGNAYSGRPRINANGRFVAFESKASNLTDDDANATQDIFVRDRDYDGNGIYDETNKPNCVKTVLVSRQPDEKQFGVDCYQPYISADGRFVAFTALGSSATFYVRDRDVNDDGLYDQTGDVRTYYGFGGSYGYGGDLSPDGRFSAYREWMGGMQKIHLQDWAAFQGIVASAPLNGIVNGASGHPSIGWQGRYMAFQSGDTNLVFNDFNGKYDVFLRVANPNNWTNTYGYELISSTPDGLCGNNHSGGGRTYWDGYTGLIENSGVAMTPNGRYVAFLSMASNLAPESANNVNELLNVYVRDRGTNMTYEGYSISGRTERVEADLTAPWWPSPPEAWVSKVFPDSFELRWTPATDDVMVLAYEVRAEGMTSIMTTSPACVITGLPESASYTFGITPFDGAGNVTCMNAITVTVTKASAQLNTAGDFDADNKDDPTIVADGQWTFWLSSAGYAPLGPIAFEAAGGVPVAGDFDGDRRCDPTMAADGQWTFWLSSAGYAPLGPIAFEMAGGVPVAGDFDGDRRCDPTMAADGQWTFWLSSAGYAPLGPISFVLPGGIPVAGDFDGDRRCDPTMAADGQWTFWLSSAGYAPLGPVPFKTASGMPAAGDFDGDTKADPVMTTDRQWTFWLSTGGYHAMGPIPFGDSRLISP